MHRFWRRMIPPGPKGDRIVLRKAEAEIGRISNP